jgi:CHAT domain-containing protein
MGEALDDPTTAIKCAQMIAASHGRWDPRAVLRAVDRIDELTQRTRWEEGLELVHFGRGGVHITLKNFDLARSEYEELIRLGELHGNPRTVEYAMMNLADIAFSEARYGEAVKWFRKVGANARTDSFVAGLVEIGEVDEAESMVRSLEATSLAPTACALLSAHLSAVELRRGNVRPAIDAANEALDRASTRGPAIDPARGLSENAVAMIAMTNRARAFRLAGSLHEAERDMRSVVEMVEDRREAVGGDALTRALASRDQLAMHVELVELLVEQQRIEEALAMAELMKARGLRYAIGSGRIDVSASMSDAERAREAALEQEVVTLNRELLRARRTAGEDLEERLAIARRELDAFRAEMRVKYPAVGRGRAEEDATLALPANAASLAAIEYVVAKKQVIAFVITRDGVHAERLPIAKEQLARESREVAELAAARSPAYRTAAARLYASLLAPLEKHLRGATTLAIIPDGVLWAVPFHALVTPGGAAVIDRRAIFYAHSLALLSAPAVTSTARSRLLALGNPSIGAGPRARLRAMVPGVQLGPLVEAEEEVRSLASMYPARATYFRGDAREAVFKDEAPNYGIIHIAAHAIVNDRAPMYSAIVLAPSGNETDDGLLEAREVVDLPLNAELAVLSACETARGQVNAGEGMIGLPWAFFVAGCPTTIVSQWKAESASTAALMVDLHTRLRAGATVAEALRGAQLAVRKRREYSHPFYWAPFVAIGAAAQAAATESP